MAGNLMYLTNSMVGCLRSLCERNFAAGITLLHTPHFMFTSLTVVFDDILASYFFLLGGECWKEVVMKEIWLILVSEPLISMATRSYLGEIAPNTVENWLDRRKTVKEDSRTPKIESVELRSCLVD